MASDVSKTVAFLSSYSSELVQLDKHTLEALLKSNRASHVKEWKAAQNFWTRKLSTLLPQHREELEDWEFILCNMSKLEPAAFLPRLRRCFNRVDSFIAERAEAIHKLACQNLETALQRKHMLQFPMSTFTRIFLERYKDELETEQMEGLSMWTENLCVQSASDRDAVTARRAARLISVQEFFAHFAAEIVGLQKQTLRDVVVSNEATPFCFASDNIRHPALLFPSGMSFLTTNEVMTFRGSLQSAQQVRQSMKEWASYPYWWHLVASVNIISFMVCLFWLPNNVNKAANVCASVAVRFMLKMMDLDDVTVEQCSRVTSSRWSFIFQVKVWPQVCVLRFAFPKDQDLDRLARKQYVYGQGGQGLEASVRCTRSRRPCR